MKNVIDKISSLTLNLVSIHLPDWSCELANIANDKNSDK